MLGRVNYLRTASTDRSIKLLRKAFDSGLDLDSRRFKGVFVVVNFVESWSTDARLMAYFHSSQTG